MEIEKLVFELYKDKTINLRKYLTEMCQKTFGDINYRDVYVNIYNYQLKKYGSNLHGSCYVDTKDWVKVNVQARQRKYMKLN